MGLHVARELKLRVSNGDVDILEVGTAGLGILDFVRGYERLILVDAIVTGAAPGTVHVLSGPDVALTSHLGPGHEADLPTVLALGERLSGGEMPKEVIVVAVEAKDVASVSTDLTREVRAAVYDGALTVEAILSRGSASEA